MPGERPREERGPSPLERAHLEVVEQEKKRARYKKIIIIALVLLALSFFSIALNLLELIK